MGILARGGYELTPRADEAEVLVVNTCSFIEAAQKESVDAILEMAEHKKFGAAKKLIVAGCLVERYRAQILEQVPEVDAIVGTGEVERILEAVEGDLRMLPAAAPAFLYHDLTPRVVTTPRHAAYIKIAEGCDHPCTFCIIPQLRGKFRSRRFESVVREAQNLAASGAREITLIGQDTTSYGEDLGLRNGLAQLLARLTQVEDLLWVRFLYAYPNRVTQKLLAQVEDLLWVRFLYAYPNRVTQKLLDTLASHPRIARYMDMPLQHASRNMLARMKRGSQGDTFLKLLERIRATIPGVSLRTSFIVGFPGETESDFAELCDFVRAAKLDWMGVFEYSDVDNAASFPLADKVAAATITDRRNQLMAIQKKISRENLRAKKGITAIALVEGPSKDNPLVWEARLEGMAPEIDGKVYLTDIEVAGQAAETGDVARVEITKSDNYDLIARVVEILPRSVAPAISPSSISASVHSVEQLTRISTGAALRVLG